MITKSNKIDIETLNHSAQKYGLVIRGGFRVEATDSVPDFPDGEAAAAIVLFGNAGSSLWPEFSSSKEYADGLADPLDRWSERIGNQLARQWHSMALFPFGGPPFQPFLRWAKKAEKLESSRLGMLIHPEYGLWHAYRFAIAFSHGINGLDISDEISASSSPCETCEDQPCLKGCPVKAFTADGYDVESCFHFLDQQPEALCHSQGCQARRACPEGASFGYKSEHAAFHMAKFYASLGKRFKP